MCLNTKATQVIFIFIDLLFLLMGLGMVAAGVWIHLQQADVLGVLTHSEYANSTVIMVAAGILVIIVSIIGCIGALMKQQCCLCLYVVCVIIVFGMEIAAGVVAYLNRDKLENTIQEQLLEGMRDESTLASWDNLQNELRCCGVLNATDWYIEGRTTVPDSCCRFDGCGANGITMAHPVGCYTTIKNRIKDNLFIIGGVGIGLGVCQLLALFSGIFLLCHLRYEKKGILA